MKTFFSVYHNHDSSPILMNKEEIDFNLKKSQTISLWTMCGGNVLWIPVLALTGIGLLFIYSASSVYSASNFGNEFYFVRKQAFFLFPAIIAGFFGVFFPLKYLFQYIKPLFCFSLLLTFMTHVSFLSRKVSGASRWLSLGPFSLQPAEFLKIFTIIFLVSLLIKKQGRSNRVLQSHKINPLILNLFLLFLAPIAIILQKDLGTTLVVISGFLSVLFMNGLPKRFFVGIFAALLLGISSAIIVEPYRIARIMTFLNPFKDPLGSGFQIIQSFVAVANGGILGRGIGESQQKLFFLPEAHTDFILAVITEEMGFIGILLIAILYVILYYAILRIIVCTKNHRDRLFAAGVFSMLVITTIINMGVVAGALPTKGLPLPFISNGGSALIANFFLIGLMSQLSRRIYLARNEKFHDAR